MLEVGDVAGDGVVLAVEQRPRHCAGLFARVLRPGVARVGDRVVLRPAGASATAGQTPG